MSDEPRKIRMDARCEIPHHRCGWMWVEDGLAEALGADHAPTRFIGTVELHLSLTRKPIEEPWIGIVHNAVDVPPEIERLYPIWVSLAHYQDLLRASLPSCRGLFTLSEHLRRRLRRMLLPMETPVEVLLHPTPLDVRPFCWDTYRLQQRPRIIQLGHWFRRFHAIYDLPTTGFTKMWLQGRELDPEEAVRAEGRRQNAAARVQTPGRLPNSDYDELLASSLALVPLYDASACNSLLECVARATPVLTPPLPAVREYLGDEYPLYYRTLDQAARLAEDAAVVEAAHRYLAELTKEQFSRDNFVESLAGSRIYCRLPPT